MKILMLETMTYGDDISLEHFNRLGEVVTYSLVRQKMEITIIMQMMW